MFAIASAPAKQSVGETITTLSGRLASSTLLEDRRAAILGLRSFAKDYPASVASDSLRGLIESLRKDGEDVDTVKVVLETLLMLFNPNENSAEASAEIALWLADEFTQRQDNITLLLNFLEAKDFHSRLYSLQLLSAIQSSRAERTEECIFTAPLGISRLVTVLDDQREAIRNEALSLLTYLTPTSIEVQKLVAFENAFDRIFKIIKLEGSLLHGDRVVEDCLILLANLLRMNVSNQSFFRETGGIPKLARLLREALAPADEAEVEVAGWALRQGNRNVYALLAVLRLFLTTGGVGTQANQASFWQQDILNLVVELAFSHSTEIQIKAEALTTCADLIRDNNSLQEGFAQLQVMSVLDEPIPDGMAHLPQNGIPKVYVIDGLLDLTLSIPTLSAFDSRLAACECIKAYFSNHSLIRRHFLRRAIDGHTLGSNETANVVSILLQSLDTHIAVDPYRYWFASVIVFHLVVEDANAKNLAMSVAEGDASNGEEVVTCIQCITENMLSGIRKGLDQRIIVAYLMLLCGWLFEDPDAVNDFLGEGSNIQSLVEAALQTRGDGVIVQGLCAILLGIIYEFSTKDSPVSRGQIHPILASKLGRDQYIDKLTKLRSHPVLRDFEVLPQRLSSAVAGGFPEVFFDKGFVDFLKDNYNRLLRAIDRDPGMEVPVMANGVQRGISREMVDSLRSQLVDKDQALQKSQEELASLARQLGQEQADHRRAKETAAVELTRIKNVNDALQRHHEADISKLRAEQGQIIQDYQRRIEHAQKSAEVDAERHRKRTDAEIADLQKKISQLEADLFRGDKDHVQDLQIARDEYTSNRTDLERHLACAEEKAKEAIGRVEILNEQAIKAEAALKAKEIERQTSQTELEELLMVFEDVEERSKRYRERLRSLGEIITDGEDNGEEGEDGKDEESETESGDN